jgi:four helix bundle protein
MKSYDLEERTLEFAVSVRKYLKVLPKTVANIEDSKQAVRSSGSIGSNYIEANEKLGPKDLRFRLRIARKEAKETVYWLRIIKKSNDIESENLSQLIQEGQELRKILSAIIKKLD